MDQGRFGDPLRRSDAERPQPGRAVRSTGLLALTAVLAAAARAGAEPECRILCPPSVKLEPTVTFSNPFGGARVRLPDGTVAREPSEAEFEIILAVDVPTRLRRVGLTAEAIWTPFASGSFNPFTGRGSAALGGAPIRDNPVELELELNLKWLLAEQTGGWVSSHLDVVDKFSPAERPGDRATYTHKLDLELDAAVSPFNWLADGHWLRSVEIEGSLDYVATGLPRAGDEVAPGEVYLDPASPWSFSLVLVIQLAPW